MRSSFINSLHFFRNCLHFCHISAFICVFFISGAGYSQGMTEVISIQSGTTANLWGVSFANETTGYAVGDNGLILKTNDGGDNWHKIKSPVTKYLTAIQFVNSTTGYIVGDSGAVLKTTDGGNNWQALNFPNKYLTELSFVTPEIGYVGGGYNHFIWKTRDGGLSWTADSINFTNGYTPPPSFAVSFSFADTATGYMCSAYGWLGKPHYPLSMTSNGAVNWTSKAAQPFGWSAVTCLNKDTVFACGNGIIKSTDGVNSYSTVSKVKGLSAISFAGDNGYAVGNSIIKTTDGGNTWDSLAYDSSGLNAVYTINSSNAIAVGAQGAIIKLSSGCSQVASITGASPVSVAFSIYPNPNSGSFTIASPGSYAGSGIKVYNTWGQEVKSAMLTGRETSINLGTVTPGIYYVSLPNGGEKQMQKMVVE